MDVIDDDGAIFGVVNIVDVIAILLVLGAVVSGVVLVDQSSEPAGAPTTRFVTVTLGQQPQSVAGVLSEGDTMTSPEPGGNLTVTDVYVTPAGSGNVSILVRAEVDGLLVEAGSHGGRNFVFAGEIVRPGSSLTIATSGYDLEGRVVSVSTDERTLRTSETATTIVGTVPATVARNVEPGDRYVVQGRTVAEVTDVYVGPGPSEDTRNVVLRASLATVDRSDGHYYSGRPLHLGSSVSLDLGNFEFSGRVRAVGDDLHIAERVVTVRTTVGAETARMLSEGDTYRLADRSVARLESVAVFPTANATRRRVVLVVRLRTYGPRDDRSFGAFRTEIGRSIPFATGDYRLSGTIVDLGPRPEPGGSGSITATVTIEDVGPELSDAIQVGMEERDRGTTYARVTGKRVEPASVVLTSDDGDVYLREHPRNLDVSITVEMRVRETASGYRFHGRSLRLGETVVIDFGTVTVRGRVTDIPSD